MLNLFSSRDLAKEAARLKPLNGMDYSLTLPPCSWLPVRFTSYLTGREKILNALAEILSDAQETPAPIILAGQSGIGKAQTAGALIGKQTAQYEGVHWIEAGDPANIPYQIAACGEAAARGCRQVGWPERPPKQVELTLKSWQESPNRLVIFNHLDDLEILADWVAQMPGVRVLATSTRDEWPEPYRVLYIKPLPVSEAVALLSLIAPRLEKTPPEELNQLTRVLSGHPYLVSLAGCYLRERSRVSVKDYLAEIEKISAELSPAAKKWTLARQKERTPQMAAAILLMLQLLEGQGEREAVAWRLFHTAAFFAPGLPIPTQALTQLTLASLEHQPLFDWCLAWLYHLGLLSPSPYGPVMHPLVASLTLAASPNAAHLLSALAENYLGMVSSAQSSETPNWLLFPHMAAIGGRAEKAELKPARALFNRLGALLVKAGQSGEARGYLERSLAINARSVDGDRVESAAASAALGHTLSDLGDLPAARASFEKALAAYERVFGPSYAEVATVAGLLGHVLYEMGDLAGAKAQYERALAIHENAFGFGPNHPAVINEVDHLGQISRDMGDLPAARKYFERALAAEEALNGPSHPNIATHANNLGRVLYKQGNLAGARDNFERALAVLKMTDGPENIGLSTALNNLGLVLQDLGSVDKARECFERSLAIDEKVHGREHPNVARDLNNLGSAYSGLGRLADARDCFTRALQIDIAIFGDEHPNNAINANNLGRVLYNLGDLTGAQKSFERALELDKKLNGPEHPRVGTDLNNLGTVLFELGELPRAGAAFEQSLAIFSKHYPADHPKIAYAKKYLNRITAGQK